MLWYYFAPVLDLEWEAWLKANIIPPWFPNDVICKLLIVLISAVI